MLNKKQYDKLKQYEKILHTAYYGMYLMGCSYYTAKEIGEIAKQAGYKGSSNYACNTCKLKMCQWIGKEYFAYKDEQHTNEVKKGKKKGVENV